MAITVKGEARGDSASNEDALEAIAQDRESTMLVTARATTELHLPDKFLHFSAQKGEECADGGMGDRQLLIV